MSFCCFVCRTGRAENSQLHQQRETLIRDHELVCRENERLLRKLSVDAADMPAMSGLATDNARTPIDDHSAVSDRLSQDRNALNASNASKELKGSRRQVVDNEVQTKQTDNGSIGMSYIGIILYFNNANVCGFG